MKALPNNVKAERSLLGWLLRHPEQQPAATELLEVCDFYCHAHKHVFAVMLEFAEAKRVPPDRLMVVDALLGSLRLTEAGGDPYLRELFDVAPALGNLQELLQAVLVTAVRRELVKLCVAASDAAGADEFTIADVIDDLHNRVGELSSRVTRLQDRFAEDFALLALLPPYEAATAAAAGQGGGHD